MSYQIFIKQNITIFFISYIINKISIDSFCFFNFLIFTITKEYIFDVNPKHSLIIFPLTLSFILPITFLLTGSKTFEYSGESLKSNKFLFS